MNPYSNLPDHATWDAKQPAGGEPKSESAAAAGSRFHACAQNPPPATNGREARLLLLLGPREANLYRMEVTGGKPEQLLSLPAPQRTGSTSDYESIARSLRTPGKILISAKPGPATRGLRHFVRWLTRMHPRLSKRIAGLLPLDDDMLSPSQLLDKAREFHAHSGFSH